MLAYLSDGCGPYGPRLFVPEQNDVLKKGCKWGGPDKTWLINGQPHWGYEFRDDDQARSFAVLIGYEISRLTASDKIDQWPPHNCSRCGGLILKKDDGIPAHVQLSDVCICGEGWN